MNKALKSFLIAVVAIISIASCKKSINYDAFAKKNCKLTSVKAAIDVLGVYNINYSYDATGNLVKATTTDGQTNTFSYTANKITATDGDGEVVELVISNGRAVSSASASMVFGNGYTFSKTKKYTYNTDGYLSVVETYLNGDLNSTDKLTYTNGNLTKTVSTFEYTGFEATTSFEYTTDLAVNTYEMVDPLYSLVDYFAGGYYGKTSKNVLKQSTSVTVDGNSNKFSEDKTIYSYQFDAKGNAISVSTNQLANFYPTSGPSTTDTYISKYDLTYTCN